MGNDFPSPAPALNCNGNSLVVIKNFLKGKAVYLQESHKAVALKPDWGGRGCEGFKLHPRDVASVTVGWACASGFCKGTCPRSLYCVARVENATKRVQWPLTLIPSRNLWGSRARKPFRVPHFLVTGNRLHSASLTFPEFQEAGSNRC